MNSNFELPTEGVSLYKKYTQDIGLIAITQAVIALRGLIILPIITKTLSASGYGIWAQAIVTASLILPISSLLLSSALLRFLAAEKTRQKIRDGFFSVAISILCWSSFIALIMFLLADPIANTLFKDADATQIVKIIALIIPIQAVDAVCLDFFRTFRQMKTYSILRISKNIGEVGLIAYLVLSGFGVFGALIAVLAVGTFLDIIMLGMIASRVGIRWPSFSNVKAYLNFSLPLIPSSLSSWATSSSDRYVIGFFMGVAPIGVYSAGYHLGWLTTLFIGPFAVVLAVALSKLYDEERMGEVKTHLSYSLKYFLMLAIPSAFGLSVLAKPLLLTLATSEFVPMGSLVIPIVALSGLLFGVYVIFSHILWLTKRTKIVGILWGAAALLNLALNIIFVPRFGVLAAAATTLVSYSLVAGITIFISSKHLRFDTHGVFLLKSVVASLVMSVVIWQLNPVGWVNILWVIGLGALIYFTVLFLAKGFSLNEIRFFRHLFQRG